jgi:protein-S-isoprenylcysteine O-methyltransferase Ste14
LLAFGLIALAPRTLASLPEWSPRAQAAGRLAGGLMLFSGTLLAVAGTFNLGRKLTPFICLKADSVLLEKGAYRLVRHPIYSRTAADWIRLGVVDPRLADTLLRSASFHGLRSQVAP